MRPAAGSGEILGGANAGAIRAGEIVGGGVRGGGWPRSRRRDRRRRHQRDVAGCDVADLERDVAGRGDVADLDTVNGDVASCVKGDLPRGSFFLSRYKLKEVGMSLSVEIGDD